MGAHEHNKFNLIYSSIVILFSCLFFFFHLSKSYSPVTQLWIQYVIDSGVCCWLFSMGCFYFILFYVFLIRIEFSIRQAIAWVTKACRGKKRNLKKMPKTNKMAKRSIDFLGAIDWLGRKITLIAIQFTSKFTLRHCKFNNKWKLQYYCKEVLTKSLTSPCNFIGIFQTYQSVSVRKFTRKRETKFFFVERFTIGCKVAN